MEQIANQQQQPPENRPSTYKFNQGITVLGGRESEYIHNYLPITNHNSASAMIYSRDSNYEARPSADSNGRDSAGKSLFYYQNDEGQKKRILVSLIMTLGITQTIYLNIPTFLPEFRSKFHPKINDGEIGIILS